MVKGMVGAYFKTNSLVKQQLDSYNKFIDIGIQSIIDKVKVIKTNVVGFELKLGIVRIVRPRFYEVIGGYKYVCPCEASM